MTEATRARALELRGMALYLLRGRGEWPSVRTPEMLLVWEGHDIFMMHWVPRLFPTPFDRVPKLPKGALPCGLAIAFKRRKVLDIGWTNEDDGRFEIISYKPGEWELQLSQHYNALEVEAATLRSEDTTNTGEAGVLS